MFRGIAVCFRHANALPNAGQFLIMKLTKLGHGCPCSLLGLLVSYGILIELTQSHSAMTGHCLVCSCPLFRSTDLSCVVGDV
ncbi:hypothetical protein BV25DRAFT_724633 [Artomyces pyxidatus]|uniref:Uncharacterized protein n=1 Tax=Artomyces pyxidatus TaxID=48021 RepID=A0ACB8SZF8_9AGAM|nr:hypothetical protein BV25DRAFT_724633 [Artomyces pyxidatus]